MITLRCSELDRRLSCPGSLTLESRVAPRQSEEGAEGTAIHAEIAFRLFEDHGAFWTEYIPMKQRGISPISTKSPHQWLVSYCVREVIERVPADWSLEVETPLAYEFDGFILSGHIDAVAISPDGTEAIGFDYKTGYNAVDAAECNEQVLGYLVLLKRAYPSLRKATFYIVQPRNDEDLGQERVSKVEVEFLDPSSFMGVDFVTMGLERRLTAALARPMDLETGKQCRFCAAKLQCSATIAEMENMKLTLTPEALAAVKTQPDDKTLADWVTTAKTLESAMEEAREMAKERIAAQGYITAGDGTNISVKETAGAYEVVNPQEFQKALLTMIPVEALAEVTKPSMAKVKDKIAEVMDIPKTGKKAMTAEGLFDSRLRIHTTQGTRKVLVFS